MPARSANAEFNEMKSNLEESEAGEVAFLNDLQEHNQSIEAIKGAAASEISWH